MWNNPFDADADFLQSSRVTADDGTLLGAGKTEADWSYGVFEAFHTTAKLVVQDFERFSSPLSRLSLGRPQVLRLPTDERKPTSQVQRLEAPYADFSEVRIHS